MDDWERWLTELIEIGLIPIVVVLFWVISRIVGALTSRRDASEPEAAPEPSRDEEDGRLPPPQNRPIVPR